jgi:hypothetical protein
VPNELDSAKGIFGHIRLYTTSEMEAAMSKLGFFLERSLTESNAAGYRGSSAKSFRSRIYRLYERAEAKIGFLRRMGDTWYMAFRKAIAKDSAPQLVELEKLPS